MAQTKMKKVLKVLALLLTGVGMIAMLVVGAMFLAQNQKVETENHSVVLADTSGTCGDNLTWTFDSSSGVLTISGTGAMTSHPWTDSKEGDGIAPYIRSAVIGNGVTSIASYAFDWCTNLVSVTIGSSVTSIGNSAFGNRKLCEIYNLSNLPLTIGAQTYGYVAWFAKVIHTSLSEPSVIVTDSNGYQFACFSGEYQLINYIGSGTTLTLPSSFDYYGTTVTEYNISESAFFENYGLTSVTIPGAVKDILDGDYLRGAFYGCSNLNNVILSNGLENIGVYAFSNTGITSITIPNSVVNIGSFAFIGSNLTSIEIPGSVESMGDCVFRWCYNLSTVTIHNGVTSIGYGAFWECTSLESITIPDSVTTIGNTCFMQCTNLTNAILSNNITELKSSTFYGCNKLAQITIPNNLITIQDDIFNLCRSLKNVTFNDKLETIGNNAFSGCTNLRSISLPESLTSIGNYAFQDCVRITSLNIPKNVESIGANIVANCTNLNTLRVDNENIFYNDGDGNNVIIRNSDNALIATSRESEITNATTVIGDGAFKNRLDLINVLIPYGVTSIGAEAFMGCSNLVSISIPNTVTSIGGSAFKGCSSLVTINIPNSVTSLGPMSFMGCSSLVSITIPGSITDIPTSGYYPGGVFANCSNLQSVVLNSGLENIGQYAFFGCVSLTDINIPNTVTSIQDFAFHGCRSLNTITIPNSLTSIPYGAFYECTSLSTINLPNSLTSIGSMAFHRCINLDSISLPNGLMSIGGGAFWGCATLTSINIPSSLTNMDDTFMDCAHLTTITVDNANPVYNDGNGSNKIIETATGRIIAEAHGSELIKSGTCGENVTWTLSDAGALTISGTGEMTSAPWQGNAITSVVIEEGVTNIYGRAFCDCEYLISVTIGSSVLNIGSSAFYNCQDLEEVIISEGLETISDGAFRYCGALKTISLPNSLTTIGNYAFSNCYNLTSVNFGSGLTSIGDNAFYQCNLSSISIPRNVSNISSSAFIYCNNITQITVDGNNTKYNDGNGKNCLIETLTNKIIKGCNASVIPNTVTSIENSAFTGCSELRTVDLNNITSIGESAFSGCTNLTLIIRSTSVPTLGNNAFGSDGYNFINRILVPQSAVNAYKAATNWTNYVSIIDGYSSGTQFNILWQNYNGDELAEDLVEIGKMPVFTAAPPTRAATVKYNYEWDGWTTPIEIATEDAVYTASYNKNGAPYTITYDSNDGTTRTLTQNVVYAGSFTTYNYDAFERNGYKIIGWSKDPITQTGIYSDVNTYYGFEDTENITLYAVWDLIDYVITYNLDGGITQTSNPDTYTIEDEITLNNPTKDGYDTFVGWTGSNGVNPETTVIIPQGSTGNKEYTANYSDPTVYTITTTVDGVETSQNYTVESEDITLVNPTKDYYDFTGWTGTDLTDPELVVTIPTGSYGDREYTANWEAIEYTITYILDGGTASNPETYTIESESITLVNPTKKGYTFLGWTGSNGESPQTTVTIPAGSTGNREYTANWEIITYTITTIVQGVETKQNYTVESASITLVQPTRDGATFRGWTGTNGTTPQKNITIAHGSTGDRTYTANWTLTNYTLKYTLYGGTVSPANPTKFNVETETFTLNNPTKANYDFLGWTGGGLTEPILEVTIETGSLNNRTYVANWTPTEYTITYTLNGGTAENPAIYTVESENITLTNPTKLGYTFIGWTGTDLDEETLEVVIPQGSTGNKAYTANFEVVVYTITTTVDGVESIQNYTVESESITLTNPNKAGYTFTGWTGTDLDEETMEVVIPQGSTGNKAYTANFEVIVYTIKTIVDGVESTQNYTVESANITLSNPTKEGYTFTGWTGTDLDEETMEVVISQGSTGNREYTANFEVNTYTIKTIVDGVEHTQNYTIESENITLVNPSKEGYTFLGWTGENLTEPTLEVVVPKGSTGDREYTANFEEEKASPLALILGLSIPLGALFITGIVLLILAKQKKIKLW